jgi:hypothetical protein
MTDKTIAFKFAISTTLVIALGIMILPSAVKYFVSINHARADRAVASQITGLPNPQLSRVRLLVSTMK